MAYKEIVTKTVIGKGKKKYTNDYFVDTENKPTTVLGCWIINHNFEAHEVNNKIVITGSYDANIWYAYDNDTKTTVISKKIDYSEEEKLYVSDNNVINKEIIVRSLKQPTCISAKSDDNKIKLVIEKELGIEIVGDAKVRISSLEEDDDNWDDLESVNEENVGEINPNYIDEEIVK